MPEPLKLDTLVELRDQYSNVYQLSPTGARGWVRAKREYPKTDPQVYLEWDKDHWRYHGEPDGWTFEHHFRPVDDEIPDYPDMHEILSETRRAVEPETCAHCGDNIGQPVDDHEAFLNDLLAAQEAAIGSEGYFIITLSPVQDGQYVVYKPSIFSGSLTPVARGLIETQITLIASELFQRQAAERVQEMEDGPGR